MSTFALKKEQYIYNICKLVVTNILRYLWTLYIIEYRNSTKKRRHELHKSMPSLYSHTSYKMMSMTPSR